MFEIDCKFVFEMELMVVKENDVDVYFVGFVLVDDYDHQSKYVIVELIEKLIMVLESLMIDDVLQQMLMQRLDEELTDLLDDDF